MTINTQYAETVREARAQWAQAVDGATEGAKKYADRVRNAIAVKPEYTDGAFDYLNRALDAQGDVGKRFAAVSTDFTTTVLAQWVALAEAARDYAGDAQDILREQADARFDEYVSAVERATPAFASVTKTATAA